MTSFFLTEVAQRERLANQSRTISLLTWVCSIALVGLALSPIGNNKPAKVAILLSAAALTAASRATAGNLAEHDRVLQDYRDTSDHQRQQAMFELLKPKQLLKSAEPIPIESQTVTNGTDGLLVRHDWQPVFSRIQDQNEYPAVVIIGPQGTGKTTLVNYLLSIIKGRTKKVLDPHYIKGSWPGCVVIGGGQDYAAVARALKDIQADVKRRYQELAEHGRYTGENVTVILEEQTNWSSKVPGAKEFLKETLSDMRKVGYQTIAVSHGETNEARGGSSGTAKMRKEGELKIVLKRKGLAVVTVKGLEEFELSYPDPKPYTVAMGAATVEVPAMSAWDEFKANKASNMHGMERLMNWIEKQEAGFTDRQVIRVTSLRTRFAGSCNATADIRALVEALMKSELLTLDDDGYYNQLSV